ncbi:hypothetical protein SEVIR_2G300400v4 [Setaria viridis]|uniref:Uncharacterized protein n=2 Tax=Setaria TaxID=4554 RepID=K3ZWD5_SETIT|nr:ribonuclease 3 [Setaria italica]XP_034581313.1 ribonuclease 3-like isoform X1 [Setaria viridis]RCV12695.1 hypothetical protein SETIT_2G289500v2 [Setaria italica]TKW34341.1 hypothetical protein SEVIR_2G300400v2 [Setaria viridis]
MARRTIVLSLILGLLAAANAVPFDFFYLILMWPGAYCEDSDNGCCVPKYGYPAEDFFVKSFQTFDLSINKPIVRCRNGAPFDNRKMNKIENGINHYWSNIKCPPTDGMNTWKSEWNSYGVCSGLAQLDYFKAALGLRTQAGILAALADQGIKPDYKLYATAKIKSAITKKLGVAPGLQCKDGPFGKKQLYEIYLCASTDGKSFIECPKLPATLSCPDAVVFHPFYTWMLNSTAAAFDSRILLPTETMLN